MFIQTFFTIAANQKSSTSISRLMDKQIVVHLCSGILLSKRKEKKRKKKEGGRGEEGRREKTHTCFNMEKSQNHFAE